MKFVKTKK